MPEILKTAVLVSGGGSNLGAILAFQKQGRLLPADVVLVISSRAGVHALNIAREFNIPSSIIDPREYSSEAIFQEALLSSLKDADIELVCLAGYLRRLAPHVIGAFRGRILNIHPSLLPNFGGAGMYGHYVHESVLKAGVKFSGCTVHVVDEEFDHGECIASVKLSVESGDTPETLAKRILKLEHALYPKTIAAFARKLIGAHHD